MLKKILIGGSVVALSALALAATAAEESVCTAPGVTVLTDAGGDVMLGTVVILVGQPPIGLPISHADLLSVQVSEAAASDGAARLVVRLGVASMTTVPFLLPQANWYVSFKAPDKKLHGLRMMTDQTGAETYQSYLVAPGGLQGDGASDGRFAEAGSEKPLDAASSYDDTGISFVVDPKDVGVSSDDAVLSSFNAAQLQTADLVAVGFADTFDTVPDGLAREGSVALSKCSGGKSLVQKFGGALGLGLLLPLLGLAGLRRRRG